MTLMIRQEDYNITAGQIGGQIDNAIQDLTSRQKQVLAILAKDDKISRRAIAEQMGINESAVLKHIEILKEKGYIERIGGTRGYWKIKKNSNND